MIKARKENPIDYEQDSQIVTHRHHLQQDTNNPERNDFTEFCLKCDTHNERPQRHQTSMKQAQRIPRQFSLSIYLSFTSTKAEPPWYSNTCPHDVWKTQHIALPSDGDPLRTDKATELKLRTADTADPPFGSVGMIYVQQRTPDFP